MTCILFGGSKQSSQLGLSRREAGTWLERCERPSCWMAWAQRKEGRVSTHGEHVLLLCMSLLQCCVCEKALGRLRGFLCNEYHANKFVWLTNIMQARTLRANAVYMMHIPPYAMIRLLGAVGTAL